MAAKPKPKKTKSKAKVPPIPKGVHTLTHYMAVAGCAKALKFYTKAFGAKEIFRLTDPKGRIGHAEMRIGDSTIMMSDEFPEMNVMAPHNADVPPIRFHLTVKDCDAFVAKALKAGARIERPIQDQFYGFRGGMIADPFGYSWFVTHQIEKVSPKQMQKRWDKMVASMKSK